MRPTRVVSGGDVGTKAMRDGDGEGRRGLFRGVQVEARDFEH